MKRFVKRTTIFFLLLSLIIVVLIVVANRLHQFYPSEGYYHHEFNKAFEKGNSDIVAIGNSKLLSALDKNTLEDKLELQISNLGYSSSNISISRLTLESYLNKCKIKPKAIVLEVSWFTFNKKRTTLHSISGNLLLNDFKLWQYFFRYSPKIKQNIKEAIINTYIHRVKPPQKELSYASKFREYTPFTKDYDFNLEAFENIFPNHVAGVDSLLLDDFYAIVEMCRKEQIALILFSAPEDEEYSKIQNDSEQINSIFTETAENDPNVYYLDYTYGGNLWNKKHENWLRNSHHINEKELFTEVLSENIKARAHKVLYE